MKKFTKIMLIVLGTGLLTAVVGSLASRSAPAQVPLPPFPPLPSVPVTVTNFPATQPVTVVNTPSQPVPTVAHVTQPFHLAMCIDYGTQAGSCQNRVPHGMQSTAQVPTTTTDGHAVERMVIENITGSCESFGQQVFELVLGTTLNENSSPANTLYDVIPVTASASPQIQTAFQQTRLYSEPVLGWRSHERLRDYD